MGTGMQAPKFEIYIDDCCVTTTLAWLRELLGDMRCLNSLPDSSIYQWFGGVLVITQGVGVGGHSTSLYLSGHRLPWDSAADLARAAAVVLDAVVYCEPGTEFPAVNKHYKVFLRVDVDGEMLVMMD